MLAAVGSTTAAPRQDRQGRGTDDRVLEVLGQEPFRDDVLASGGLDDRRTTNKYLKRAEELLAETDDRGEKDRQQS